MQHHLVEFKTNKFSVQLVMCTVHIDPAPSSNKKDGYRQLNVHQLGSLRPWDHRGKCYMDRKRIQCLSNALQHVPICLQPFLRYSSGESRGRGWRPPIDLTNFCINVKSHLRMHQNPPKLVKIQFFLRRGRAGISVYRWRVTGFQQYS